MTITSQTQASPSSMLPVWLVRNQLTERIKQNDVCIVLGETGCGKSTQIPQIVYKTGIGVEGRIAITQPRRVAALTLAARVADEMKCDLGTKVGYHVRFEAAMHPAETRILYMTDGILLREAIHDPMLKSYTTIVLDEAHERSIRTDILFSLVKKALRKRAGTLKVIVMSATMDVDQYAAFFGQAKVVYVEGREHPVELYHLPAPQDDYVYAALVTIFQIHKTRPVEEGILAFLPGTDEIDALTRRVREIGKDAHHMDANFPKVDVNSLYAALAVHTQLRVFGPAPSNHRKIVIATNIAETSLTIPGIRHVVDTCRVKARHYHPAQGFEMLKIVRISKAQIRWLLLKNGWLSHVHSIFLFLFYQFMYLQLLDYSCNLASVLLELLASGVRNPFTFDYLDPPPQAAIDAAIRELYQLGAVESVDDKTDLRLTPIGKKMTSFPLDPKLSRILIAGSELGCLEDVLSVVALMSLDQSVFVQPGHDASRSKCEESRRKFITGEGDLIMQLSVFRSFRRQEEKTQKNWCMDNFVQQRNLAQADRIRTELRDIAVKQGLSLVKAAGGATQSESIRKALCYGLFLHAAELESAGKYVVLDSGSNASIHPSSCLSQSNPTTVVYMELVVTSKCYIKDVTVVDPAWLRAAAPHYFDIKRLKS